MNSEPSQPATADTESGAQRTADCSGRGRAETYPIAGRNFLAGEASGRLLLRRFGSPLFVLAIDSSWLAFFAVYSEERRGCTCVYGLLGLSGSRLHWSVRHMGLARGVDWTPFAETTSSYAEITLLFFFEQ